MNEKRFLAEYDRLVRNGNSGPPSPSSSDLERLLGKRDLLQVERPQLEGRMRSLACRLDSIDRANKTRVLECKINALYARVVAGPNKMPEDVKGERRRRGLLDEEGEWKGEMERGKTGNEGR